MCKIRALRALVDQRLGAAVEEIFRLFEATLAEYEEEIERQRGLLEAAAERPVNKAEVAPLLTVKQEAPSEQQGAAEPLYIKEEEEEFWRSQEGPQRQGPEEDDMAMVPLVAVSAKMEGGEEKAQENREAEPAASSSEQQMEADSSESETECSDDDAKATSEPQRGATFVKQNEVHIIVEKCLCNIGRKMYRCSECNKRFSLKGSLQRHIRVHTGEKPFPCTVCGKKFGRKQHLQEHLIIHTGERPFSCSVCGKKFRYKAGMRKHMRTHECNCGDIHT
ncbi:putative zinc finger protein 32-like [Scophthalmus maximus]|nr:zinc finger protein 135 [Scophthalmus maximus]AWP07988.1 putative zinc finger protein 32-like [Scophthalmus maximus]KAF0040459.1 hypothetical protein F2P81_006357 [Scophthalmus maximus]